MSIPRSEHPNPQWQREDWLCLNGEWEFDFDFGRSAEDRKLFCGGELEKKIIVPFCPESELSGIGYKDFMPAVVYRKKVTLNEEKLTKRVILHFGAVDYKAKVYVNGEKVCEHCGGYTPFEADITEQVKEGENNIFVIAEDDVRSGRQCCGKQSDRFESYSCSYTRVTGIWQSVWLEFVPDAYIVSAKYITDSEGGIVTVCGKTNKNTMVSIETSFEGEACGSASVKSNGEFTATIKLSKVKLWDLGQGNLYDIVLGTEEDTVHSYFGLRSVTLDNVKFYLNNRPVFQRLVLDQGYYPDGIYTASSDEALKKDIEISMGLGFNGARLHQKLFEPRFLYHCDRMGYMVWDEYGNWGFDHKSEGALAIFLKEWIEVLNRDMNHPSIIGWCPFNETWNYVESNERNELLSTVYAVTKAIDSTRPCIDTSGNYHVITDIYDVHDYEQDPEKFAEYYAKIGEGIVNDQTCRVDVWKNKQSYDGKPVFMSEYGGMRWVEEAQNDDGWGYGNAPKNIEEVYERYKGLTDALLDNPYMLGFCYTQLYDVEQEKNGLYTYERKAKFDDEVIRKINMRTADVEK